MQLTCENDAGVVDLHDSLAQSNQVSSDTLVEVMDRIYIIQSPGYPVLMQGCMPNTWLHGRVDYSNKNHIL